MNVVQNRPVTQQPYRGRVVGAGTGHRHSHYYPETKLSREERKRLEAEQLKEELKSSVKESINMEIQDQVAKQVNAILPTLQASIVSWIDGGRKGPMPMISLGSSHSLNVGPNVDAPAAAANPAANTLTMENRAATKGALPEQSPVVSVPRSSPSVSCGHVYGPSTLAELDALTVIN